MFAKGDHVNVGVGAWQEEGPRIREHLADVCRAHGLEMSQLESLRGHRLPLRRPGTIVANERALLVGDAAGLIDPVSGDGMYECFVSSKLAAEAILAGQLDTYAPRLDGADRRPPSRIVDAEARTRPLAACLVAARAHGASLAERRAAADRRAGRAR